MPGGEARVARGVEPAGAPGTPKRRRLPACAPTQPARQWSGARASCHAWQDRCALWYAYAYHGRERRIGTAVPRVANGRFPCGGAEG